MSPYTPMFVPGFTETEELHVIFFGENHLQVLNLSIPISTMTFSVAGEGGLGLISCSCNFRALFQSIDWLLPAKYFTFSSAWNAQGGSSQENPLCVHEESRLLWSLGRLICCIFVASWAVELAFRIKNTLIKAQLLHYGLISLWRRSRHPKNHPKAMRF